MNKRVMNRLFQGVIISILCFAEATAKSPKTTCEDLAVTDLIRQYKQTCLEYGTRCDGPSLTEKGIVIRQCANLSDTQESQKDIIIQR